MAVFRAGILKQRTYNQIGVYLNKLKKELGPRKAKNTNRKILQFALDEIRNNFKNERQGNGSPFAPIQTGGLRRDKNGKIYRGYAEWKAEAIRKGYNIGGRKAKGPNKVMTLTRAARNTPRAGLSNASFITGFDANSIFVESIVSRDGRQYGKIQTLQGRDFMPSVKKVRNFAIQVYEDRFKKVKPR